ncbi:MAG: isochorismatase family cysteine hydrolase [Actinocrinis sp.]
MPLTALDRNTALVVVDLQAGVVPLPLAHPTDDVVGRSVALLRAFRRLKLPVVLVNVAGSPPGRTDEGNAAAASGAARGFPDGWDRLVSELDQQPDDILVTKRARSAFSGTGLADRLRELGVTQVVVTGIATSSGVESTARAAHEAGFHVTLPHDAMTDSALERHEHSVERVFPRIAETGTTQDVLDLLSRRS